MCAELITAIRSAGAIAVVRKSSDGIVSATSGSSVGRAPRSVQPGSHRAETDHPAATPTSWLGTYRFQVRGQTRMVARQVPATAISAMPSSISRHDCDHRRKQPMPDMNPVSTMCGR